MQKKIRIIWEHPDNGTLFYFDTDYQWGLSIEEAHKKYISSLTEEEREEDLIADLDNWVAIDSYI